MDNNWLSSAPCVFDRSTLCLQLQGYRRVNDKISYMIAKEEIIPLMKGKYIATEAYRSGKVSKYNIANSLYGPSYVSGFTALSYHQMIPEKVISVESVTPLRSKKIETPIGRFEYLKMPVASFHVGITHVAIDKSTFLMASPTKALIDSLWTTKIKDVHGVKSMASYLFDNLRLDEESFSRLDPATIVACRELGKKKQLLTYLLKLLNQYQDLIA